MAKVVVRTQKERVGDGRERRAGETNGRDGERTEDQDDLIKET